MDRRVVPQQLFHRVREKAGTLAQQLHLLRMAQQGQQAVADQVRGGLVANLEQHLQHDVVAPCECRAGVFASCVYEPGNHVVPGLGLALFDKLRKGVPEPHLDRNHVAQRFSVNLGVRQGKRKAGFLHGAHHRAVAPVGRKGAAVEPVLQNRKISVRPADHAPNDSHGQRHGKHGHQIERAPALNCLIQQFVRRRANVVLHLCLIARAERMVGQTAKVRVGRWIREVHWANGRRRVRRSPATAVAEAFVVPQDAVDVAVARHQKMPGQNAAVTRVRLPQATQRGIGIGNVPAPKRPPSDPCAAHVFGQARPDKRGDAGRRRMPLALLGHRGLLRMLAHCRTPPGDRDTTLEAKPTPGQLACKALSTRVGSVASSGASAPSGVVARRGVMR